MRAPNTAPTHKLGANRKEFARKPRKRDRNFAQSRDIREDRGERKIKTSRPVTQIKRGSLGSRSLRQFVLKPVRTVFPVRYDLFRLAAPDVDVRLALGRSAVEWLTEPQGSRA